MFQYGPGMAGLVSAGNNFLANSAANVANCGPASVHGPAVGFISGPGPVSPIITHNLANSPHQNSKYRSHTSKHQSMSIISDYLNIKINIDSKGTDPTYQTLSE